MVVHLEAQASEETNVPAADKARLTGYPKTLKSLKFVLYMLYMKVILASLAELQKSAEVQLNTSLKVIRGATAAPTADILGPIASILQDSEDNPTSIIFKGVQLCHGAVVVVNAFKAQMSTLAKKLKALLVQRFKDIEHDDKIGCRKQDLTEFGYDIPDSFIDEFRPLLKAKSRLTSCTGIGQASISSDYKTLLTCQEVISGRQ